jgi:hypothetical protein
VGDGPRPFVFLAFNQWWRYFGLYVYLLAVCQTADSSHSLLMDLQLSKEGLLELV